MPSLQTGATRVSLAVTMIAALTLLSACGARSGPVVDAIITTTTPTTTTTTTPIATTTTTTLAPPTTAAPTTAAPPTTPPAPTVPTAAPPTTTTTPAPPVAIHYATPAPPVAQPTVPYDLDAPEAAPVIGRIRIPTIDVDMKLYDGVSSPTLNIGPGHWPGTAWPGQAGNAVIGGHRTSHHAVFRRVDKLRPGDQILIDDANGTHTYAVRKTVISADTDLWFIDQTDTATITLFACHPPGSTRQRIVVIGDLVT